MRHVRISIHILVAGAVICALGIRWVEALPPQNPGLGAQNLSPVNFRASIVYPPFVLSDTSGDGLKDYTNKIIERIRYNWSAIMPKDAAAGKKGRLSLIFVVGKNGELTDIQTASSTGVVPLDQAGIIAVRVSSPFLPFPENVSGDHLTLQTTFLYNLKPTDNAANAMFEVKHVTLPGIYFPQANGVLGGAATNALTTPEPPTARKAKSTGHLTLSVLVDAKGNATEVEDVKPIGHGLDEKAIATVRQLKFTHTTFGNSPVPARVLIVITFKLF
ncbi:MAG TPA: TonB family protein [Terriglobia bacterium]|nr:TonB family protein [Terriglobia bacterium]